MVLKNVKIKVRKNGCEETRCFIVDEISSFGDIQAAVNEHYGQCCTIWEIYYKGWLNNHHFTFPDIIQVANFSLVCLDEDGE